MNGTYLAFAQSDMTTWVVYALTRPMDLAFLENKVVKVSLWVRLS